MATTDTETVLEICTQALRKCGITAIDEGPSSYDLVEARKELGRMLKAWQNRGPNIWAYASQTVTLTTAASYTLAPVRPLSILNVRYSDGSTEIPMNELTRQEYDELPRKNSTGIPTNFYYDRQREAAVLYVWPVLATASGQTLKVSYVRELEDPVATDQVDVPSEFYECVVYNLAARLCDTYNRQRPLVLARAQELYEEALAFDREGSVSFCIGGDYA